MSAKRAGRPRRMTAEEREVSKAESRLRHFKKEKISQQKEMERMGFGRMTQTNSCLMCGQDFMAEGNKNNINYIRTCKTCKGTNLYQSGPSLASINLRGGE